MILGNIIRAKQPRTYSYLLRKYQFDDDYVEIEEDENWEFQQLEKLMSEPRGFKL